MKTNPYIDNLTQTKSKEVLWKTIALISFLVISVQAGGLVYVSSNLVSKIDHVRYILAPGIQSLTTVRPGQLPEVYVEQTFKYVVEKLHSWSYESAKSNYSELFKHFYSHDLVTRTQGNLNSTGYWNGLKERKLVSFWTTIPEESDFRWCGKVEIGQQSKGVACGIVTGRQKLFADHNIPISNKKISYLIYAINVAPTPNNMFAVQLTRLKHGPLEILKKELETSYKEGLLPLEEAYHEKL